MATPGQVALLQDALAKHHEVNIDGVIGRVVALNDTGVALKLRDGGHAAINLALIVIVST